MKKRIIKHVICFVLAAQLLAGSCVTAQALEGDPGVTDLQSAEDLDVVETWDFEEADPGTVLPEGFQLLEGNGLAGHAEIVDYEGNKVLKMSGDYPNVYIGEAFSGDLEYEARFKVLNHVGSGGIGLHFREQAVDGKLGYTTAYEANSATEANFIVRKRVGQTQDPKKSVLLTLEDTMDWHTLKIQMTGTMAYVYLDDVLRLEQELTGFDEGKIGLWTYKDTAIFDDITLKRSGDVVENASIDREKLTIVEGASDPAGFSLTLNGNSLQGIAADGRPLEENRDYTLAEENGVLKVTFTEAFLGGIAAGSTCSLAFTFDLCGELTAEIYVVPAADAVKAIDWSSMDTRSLEGELAEDLQTLIQYIDKYIVNKWWNEKKNFDSQESSEYLNLGGTSEHVIRPLSHEARTLAASLKLNIYSEDVAGVSRDDAMDMAVKLTRSLAKSHKANTSTGGWGNEWQSAFWAADAGQAGWLLWDELSAQDKEYVRAMVEYEADRFIGYDVPYYKDRDGNDISPGDSKSEENSWNADLLMLAVSMMPEHQNVDAWRTKAVELMLSAFSVPSDCTSDEVINGFVLGKTMNGYNMEENGMVINHSRVHPDYLSTVYQNVVVAVSCALAGDGTPAAALHNADRVYEAFVNYDLAEYGMPGQHIYKQDEDGNATFELNYPEGTDWGTDRQINFFLLDVMADGLGFDENCDVKGEEWAAARMPEMLRMQQRGGEDDLSSLTGEYYRSGDSDTYASREEWVAYHAISAYMFMWASENGMITITNENYSNITSDKFTSVTFSGPESMEIGETAQTTVTPNPEIPYLDDSFAKITYTSSAPEIISVSEDGKLTALREGSAEITVTVDFDGVVHEDTITVETYEEPVFDLEVYSEDFESGEIPEEFDIRGGGWIIEEEADGNQILRQTNTAGGDILIGDAFGDSFAYELKFRQSEDKATYSGTGVYFRNQEDLKDGYSINVGQLSNSSDTGIEVRERSVDGGIVNSVRKLGEIPRGEWHTLRVQVWGERVQVFVDGTEVLEGDYDTYTQGKIGLWAYKELADFDDLKIYRSSKEFARVTGTAGEGGTLSLDPGSEYVKKGASIELNVIPEAEHLLEKVTLNGEDITEKIVDGVYTLKDIQENIEVKAEFIAVSDTQLDDLQKLVDGLKGMEQGSYTDQSWAELQTALERAEAVLGKEDMTGPEISRAYAELLEARENLTEETQEDQGDEPSGAGDTDSGGTGSGDADEDKDGTLADTGDDTPFAAGWGIAAVLALAAAAAVAVIIRKRRNN